MLDSVMIVLAIAVLVVTIAGKWKMFVKAGEPGWKAIIPLYNDYISFRVFWGDERVFATYLVLVITILMVEGLFMPVAEGTASEVAVIILMMLLLVAAIAECVICAKLCMRTARSFGKGEGFATGLFFLNVIFCLILGFGDARYLGPNGGQGYGPRLGEEK